MTTHDKLAAALTEYDRKQSRKKHYNHYALGQYLARLADIDADIANGASIRSAIVAGFSGQLLDVCLKAVGETTSTANDQLAKSWAYSPASN